MKNRIFLQYLIILIACGSSLASAAGDRALKAVDLNAVPALGKIIPQLAKKRVVFIGELHTRYDHHLNQLDVIRRLDLQGAPLAIGVEFFQQPYQQYLDDYIAGKIDEHGLLTKTEYYDRWRFDFRLYAPILAFAREHRIPVIALNVPSEITSKVGRDGLSALTAEERATWVPELDDSDAAYRKRLRVVFEEHPQADDTKQNFENFLTAQLIWDEGMAKRAADYLKANPKRRLVVLAGSGHLAFGSGVPRRLTRRLPTDSAIILNDGVEQFGPNMADYLLLSEDQELPPAGTLGVVLGKKGETEISEFGKDSGAEAAGMKRGDRITSVDGWPVAKLGEIKAALWNKKPGDIVQVRAQRGDEKNEFSVNLR